MDVERTDREMEYFAKERHRARMCNLLAVHSWIDPLTGFCQGEGVCPWAPHCLVQSSRVCCAAGICSWYARGEPCFAQGKRVRGCAVCGAVYGSVSRDVRHPDAVPAALPRRRGRLLVLRMPLQPHRKGPTLAVRAALPCKASGFTPWVLCAFCASIPGVVARPKRWTVCPSSLP